MLKGIGLSVASTEFILGLDVSHWQGDLSEEWWVQAYNEGYRFAFLKATEGISFVDSRYQANKDRAQEAGFKVGAYHFARPQYIGVDQADHFINVAGDLDIGGVWDLESAGGQSDYTINLRTENFLSKLNEHYGYSWMYSGAWFLDPRPKIKPQVLYYRWAAHYTTAANPCLPKIWTDYDAWQHNSKEIIAGKYPIDANRMRKDIYKKLINGEQTVYELTANVPRNADKLVIHINRIL